MVERPVAIMLWLKAGADAITLHLREDRHYIVDADVYRMREMIATAMNLEISHGGNGSHCLRGAAGDHPAGCNHAEVTTEGGLDITYRERVAKVIEQVRAAGISEHFHRPGSGADRRGCRLGAQYVELHRRPMPLTTTRPGTRSGTASSIRRHPRARRGAAGQCRSTGLTISTSVKSAACRTPSRVERRAGIIARALFTIIGETVAENEAQDESGF